MQTTQLSQSAQFDKMTKTPIPKLVIQLGIPTTISMLVTNIYNMADTWFVGRVGISASGAVGIVFGLMAIIQAFGFMFGHGAGSIISRRLGAKDVASASRFATTSFFCSFAAGLCITAGGLLFMDPLLRLLGSTDTILPYARQYALFILLAAPFMASSCVLNNILRYEGQAAFAMVGLTSGGILNIFGDWILMEGFHLGVLGAGISTGVSQLISFGLLFYMFLAGHTQSKIAPRNMTRDVREVLLICRTGLPSLLRQGLGSVSTMMLNGQARLYGDAAVAAMSIVNRIAQFIFSFGLGIGQGFQPVSAFNYGARRYSRVKQAFLFTFLVSEVLLPGTHCPVPARPRCGGHRIGGAVHAAGGAVLPAADRVFQHAVPEHRPEPHRHPAFQPAQRPFVHSGPADPEHPVRHDRRGDGPAGGGCAGLLCLAALCGAVFPGIAGNAGRPGQLIPVFSDYTERKSTWKKTIKKR